MHTLDTIPDSLAAWDTALPQRSMLQGAQEHDKERQAHCEWLEHAIHRHIAGRDAGVLLRGLVKPRRNGPPSLASAIYAGVEDGDLQQELAQLLMDAAAGEPMQAKASDFLRKAVAAFADGEVA